MEATTGCAPPASGVIDTGGYPMDLAHQTAPVGQSRMMPV